MSYSLTVAPLLTNLNVIGITRIAETEWWSRKKHKNNKRNSLCVCCCSFVILCSVRSVCVFFSLQFCSYNFSNMCVHSSISFFSIHLARVSWAALTALDWMRFVLLVATWIFVRLMNWLLLFVRRCFHVKCIRQCPAAPLEFKALENCCATAAKEKPDIAKYRRHYGHYTFLLPVMLFLLCVAAPVTATVAALFIRIHFAAFFFFLHFQQWFTTGSNSLMCWLLLYTSVKHTL